MPKDGQDDPELLAAVERHEQSADTEGRKEAFAKMQQTRWNRSMRLPFGSLTKVQAVRSNVKGYVPFRIPRMSNVWFEK